MVVGTSILGLALSAAPQIVTLNVDPEVAALLRQRTRGHLAGSGLQVRFVDGSCPDRGLCVRARNDVFFLTTRTEDAPRRFEGSLGARAEMLALALASTLRARASTSPPPAAPPPKVEAEGGTGPSTEGARLGFALTAQGAADGLGAHPRVAASGHWGQRWRFGIDLWWGGGTSEPDPRLSLELLRGGGGLRVERAWRLGPWQLAAGFRAGVGLVVRRTEASDPAIQPESSQTTLLPTLGPTVAVERTLARTWALRLELRADGVPRILELELNRPAGPLQLDSSWPIHPVMGLGVGWRP